MRRREYTIEEMEEKAKQGYFWESDLKEWLHISQVDTEEKVRRLLQRRNPIRVAKLAENTCKDIESRLKGFCGWIYNHVTVVLCVTALILLTAFLLPIIHGVSFGTFYYEHVRVNVIMTAMIFIAMTIFISIELKIRKLDLDDATFVLYTEAENSKNGVYYDAFRNKTRRFQR